MEQILNKYLNKDIINIIKEYNKCKCSSSLEGAKCQYKELKNKNIN